MHTIYYVYIVHQVYLKYRHLNIHIKQHNLFNSTIYDEYYRILNGSTQVNSTEINNMPVPELETIQEMGRKLIKTRDFSEKGCDLILEGYYG